MVTVVKETGFKLLGGHNIDLTLLITTAISNRLVITNKSLF